MSDILQEMLKIEQEARDIVRASQKEADKILSQARIDTAKTTSEARSKSHKAAEELVESAVKEADAGRAEQLKNIDKKHKSIESATSQYIPEAVQACINQLAFSSNNSKE